MFIMRMCFQKKKALRSVRIRMMKLRMRAKKQAKLQLSGQESEKTRMNRLNKILNEIQKGKIV